MLRGFFGTTRRGRARTCSPVLRYQRAVPEDLAPGVAQLPPVGSARWCWYCHPGLCGPAACNVTWRRATPYALRAPRRRRAFLHRLLAHCILSMPVLRGPVPPEGLGHRGRVLLCVCALRLPSVGGPSREHAVTFDPRTWRFTVSRRARPLSRAARPRRQWPGRRGGAACRRRRSGTGSQSAGRAGRAGRDEHREQRPLVHEEDDLPARPVDEIRVPVPEARGRRDHLHDRHRAEAREQFLRAAKGEHVVPLPHAR